MYLNKKQTGSIYLVVIFILVVVGFLAMSLNRIEQSNHDAYTKEVLGTQAGLLAHSSIEKALTQIYPLRTTADVGVTCTRLNGTTMSFSTTMPCADVKIECQSMGGKLVDNRQLYKMTATAKCGVGWYEMQRRQDVWLQN